MKKLLILLGSLALSFTLSTASEMKCEAGKCGSSEKKDMKCEAGKCGGSDKKDMKKKEGSKCGGSEEKSPKKGKCGEGKCGS